VANNPVGSVDCGVDTFGGWVTEMSAESLPSGLSPDNAECAFAPGSVQTRGAFNKIFATAFPPANLGNLVPTMTGGKSFVDPKGNIKNLFFDSNGELWVEDVTNSPGTYTPLYASTPGSYMQSITEFGREYIAISDGLHGADIPLMYDGIFLDRYTQDAPGAPPTITNLVIPGQPLAVNASASYTVTTVKLNGTNALEVDVVPVVPANVLVPGTVITIAGNSLYNVTGTVLSVQRDFSGIVSAIFITYTGSNLGTGTGGTATSPTYSLLRSNNIVSARTLNPHGLQVGYQVRISDTTAATVTGATWVINNANLPGIATITLPGTALNGISAGETVSLAQDTGLTPWLSTSNDDLNVFTVVAAPAPNQFQIQISAQSGTAGTLKVSYAWNGIFYVTSIPTGNSFTYQQRGPNDVYSGTGNEFPQGQAAPGKHQMQVAFLRRQGGLTAPSPPIVFEANGDSYLSISNIPIGTSADIIGRVLLFTGAGGSLFYYIPVPAIIEGLIISTGTVINDNTTTSAILDFSDNTLFAAIACSIPGNNLAAQIVVDGSLGFASYASRLITYGQRNRVQNLQNMGFEGGLLSLSNPGYPLGWVSDGRGSVLAQGAGGVKPGSGWSILSGTTSTIQQSAFQDGYGAPILNGNTLYKVRLFLSRSSNTNNSFATITYNIQSPSLGILATAVISTRLTRTGAWFEATFSAMTPLSIPSDAVLSMTFQWPGAGGERAVLDEQSLIFSDNPYTDTIEYGSYINNPEGLDGLTGVFGPANDTHKIMNNGIIRGNLYMLTRDPSGNLHETSDNGTTEPSGWTINDVASDCGSLSAFCLTTSQADDNTSSGGEEWFAWASEAGARLFGGDQPWKISQEIQPNWRSRGTAVQVNMAAATTIWAINDPVDRVIYFGVPRGTATAPNTIYTVDYKELDTAYAIANGDPMRPYGGQIVTSDLVRKWSPWMRSFNGAARIYRTPGQLTLTFFNGNGQTPGLAAGFGNIYRLNPLLSTDDDYGQINSYYVTASLPSRSQEIQLQLGPGIKMLTYLTGSLSGIGNIIITPLRNTLTNAWPYVCTRPLVTDPTFDLEWVGANVWGQRIFFKVQPVPVTGTDNRFVLNKLFLFFRKNRIGVRGSAY